MQQKTTTTKQIIGKAFYNFFFSQFCHRLLSSGLLNIFSEIQIRLIKICFHILNIVSINMALNILDQIISFFSISHINIYDVVASIGFTLKNQYGHTYNIQGSK